MITLHLFVTIFSGNTWRALVCVIRRVAADRAIHIHVRKNRLQVFSIYLIGWQRGRLGCGCRLDRKVVHLRHERQECIHLFALTALRWGVFSCRVGKTCLHHHIHFLHRVSVQRSSLSVNHAFFFVLRSDNFACLLCYALPRGLNLFGKLWSAGISRSNKCFVFIAILQQRFIKLVPCVANFFLLSQAQVLVHQLH